MTTYRVLLVEDVDLVRQSIRESLEDAGFAVREATNGRIGLELLRNEPVDAVITDLWMPELDGIDLLEFLRVHHRHLPVIAMSGGAPGKGPLDYSLTIAHTYGADAVFHKPFKNDDLIEKLRELLEAYQVPRPADASSPSLA